jgi:uncharacterized protein DUF4372/DDE family transposase
MVRTASLFSQMLEQIPRDRFTALVQKHRAERYSKGFSSWTQLVAMLFCQLAGAESLREICNGLACGLGKLVHLGVDRSPRRSTLAYANSHRPAALFESMFYETLGRFRDTGQLGNHKPFRFKNKLLSLDSTTITLCLALFPWASYQRKKGGVKLHVLLNHDDYLPEYVYISEARQNDLRVIGHLPVLPAGSIIVLDRGYVDFDVLAAWALSDVFFVIRSKRNIELVRTESLPLPSRPGTILADELVVRRTEIASTTKFPVALRRVTVWDEKRKQSIEILTNNLKLAASTIAKIYRERWQIELFFKAIKQNLKIKTFVGTTDAALRTQIWTALLAILLLKWLHYLSKAGWALSTLAAMLRISLFTYRSLLAWLNQPTETPPLKPQPEQLLLSIPALGQLTAL